MLEWREGFIFLLLILFFTGCLIMKRFKILFLYLNAYYTEFLGLAENSEVEYQDQSCLISLVASGRERNLAKVQNLLSQRVIWKTTWDLCCCVKTVFPVYHQLQGLERRLADSPFRSFLFELQMRVMAVSSQSFIAPCLSLNFLILHISPWIIHFPGRETLWKDGAGSHSRSGSVGFAG